jgi:hypothetical protein
MSIGERQCVACNVMMREKYSRAVPSHEFMLMREHFCEAGEIEEAETFLILMMERMFSSKPYIGSVTKPILDRQCFAGIESVPLWANSFKEGKRDMTVYEYDLYRRIMINSLFKCDIPEARSSMDNAVEFANIGSMEMQTFHVAQNYMRINPKLNTLTGFIIDMVPLTIDDANFNSIIVETAFGYIYVLSRKHQCALAQAIECMYEGRYTIFYSCDGVEKKKDINDLQLGKRETVINDSLTNFNQVGFDDEESEDVEIEPDKNTEVLKLVAAMPIDGNPPYTSVVRLVQCFTVLFDILQDEVNESPMISNVVKVHLLSGDMERLSMQNGKFYSDIYKKMLIAFKSFYNLNIPNIAEKDLSVALYNLQLCALVRMKSNAYMRIIYTLSIAMVHLKRRIKERAVPLSENLLECVVQTVNDIVTSSNDTSDKQMQELRNDFIGLMFVFAYYTDTELDMFRVQGQNIGVLINQCFTKRNVSMFGYFKEYVVDVFQESKNDINFDYCGFSSSALGYCYLSMFRIEYWRMILMITRFNPILSHGGAMRLVKFISDAWFDPFVELISKNGEVSHISKIGVLKRRDTRPRNVVRSKQMLRDIAGLNKRSLWSYFLY